VIIAITAKKSEYDAVIEELMTKMAVVRRTK